MATTLTREIAQQIADGINAAHAQGQTMIVGVDRVKGRWAPPAQVYKNGTLAVDVQARTTRGTNTLYFKIGTPAPRVRHFAVEVI